MPGRSMRSRARAIPGLSDSAQGRGGGAAGGARLRDRVRLSDPPRRPQLRSRPPTRGGRFHARSALRAAPSASPSTSPNIAEVLGAASARRAEIYLAVRLGAGRRRGLVGRGCSRSRRRSGSAFAVRAGFEESARHRPPRSWRRCGRARRASSSACSATWTAAGRPRRLAALIRRAYTRGLGEPDSDEGFAPQALSFLDPGGEERFEPYGHDLLRLHESRVTDRAPLARRRLRARPRPSGAARCSARCPRKRSCPGRRPS